MLAEQTALEINAEFVDEELGTLAKNERSQPLYPVNPKPS